MAEAKAEETKETGEADHGKERDNSADRQFINALGNLVALAYPTWMNVTECKPVLKAIGVPQRCVDGLAKVRANRCHSSLRPSLRPSLPRGCGADAHAVALWRCSCQKLNSKLGAARAEIHAAPLALLKGTKSDKSNGYKGTTLSTAVLERHPTLKALGYDTPAFKENPYCKAIQWLYRGGKVSQRCCVHSCECERVCALEEARHDLSRWCCPE
jgi:hypothetical protein